VDAQEDLLHQILGERTLLHGANDEVEQPALVLAPDHRERLRVAALSLPQEARVRLLHPPTSFSAPPRPSHAQELAAEHGRVRPYPDTVVL
jgi:hypothetical protein